MSGWGSNANNESKPKWSWLKNGTFFGSAVNNYNKVYATGQGWVYQWAWGKEVLVAIGNLDKNMGTPNLVAVEAVTTSIYDNVNPANVAFRIIWNEGVNVTSTPVTVTAIGAGNVPNVTLSYNAALSQPSQGRLVFSNNTVNLNGYGGQGNLTVNASSTTSGFGYIVDLKDGVTVVGATIVGSNTVSVSIVGSASKSPSASASPSSSSSPSVSPSASASPSASKSPSASASQTPSPSVSPSASKSPSASVSPSSSTSASPSPTSST